MLTSRLYHNPTCQANTGESVKHRLLTHKHLDGINNNTILYTILYTMSYTMSYILFPSM